MAQFGRALRTALLAALLVACAGNGSFLMPTDSLDQADQLPAGAAAAASAGLCSDRSVWRSTPLARQPTPNHDFWPERAQYWRATVVSAAWPSAIGLAIALGLLLIFLLWRCMRCCCGWCCACCCCGGSSRKGRPFKYITARWLGCLKVLAVLLVAGLAGGCSLGMARMDAGLLDGAVQTVDDVKHFLSNAINTARTAETSAAALDGVLTSIQHVLDADVNATDISTHLSCLAPWLDGLPDPATLKADVVAARGNVDTLLSPSLADLSTQLSRLASRLAPDPTPGTYTAALSTAASMHLLLMDPSLGLVPQANAFALAAAALSSTEDPQALRAARDTLSALLSSPQPLASKLAALPPLRTALQTLQAAGVSDMYVPDAVADLTAIRGMGLDVQGISSTLRALAADYEAAAPCMVALLGRISHVNDSVLQLPVELQDQVHLLIEAKATLDGIMVTGPSPTSLAAYLDATLPVTTIDEALQKLQAAMDTRSQIQGLSLPAIITALQAAETDLSAGMPQLARALTAMDAYMGSFYPGGGMPAGAWLTLQHAVQAAGTAVHDTINQLPTLSPIFDQVPLFQVALPTLNSSIAEQQSEVSGMQAQLAHVPDVTPYVAYLDQLAGTFAALPQTRSQLTVEVQAAVDDILQAVQQALADAQATVRAKTSEVGRVIDSAERDTVGKIDFYMRAYLPHLQKYNTIRQAVLYSVFSAACLFALLMLLFKLFNYPMGLKVMTVLTLLLMAILFTELVALTVALKVGNDGCVNLDAQILVRIPDVVGSPSDAAKALAVARYYLYEQPPGSSLEGVLLQALNFDVADLMLQINATRQDLLTDIEEQYRLQPLLSQPVGQAVELSYVIQDGITQTLVLASRESVLPVYSAAKVFACCRGLDLVGSQWLAALLAGSCGVALCALAFSFIASLDKLGSVKGCCACYTRRHFVDEAPFPVSLTTPPTAKVPLGSPRQAGSGNGGKSGLQVNLLADGSGGSPHRSPRIRSGPQFSSSWHNRGEAASPLQTSRLREHYQPAAESQVASSAPGEGASTPAHYSSAALGSPKATAASAAAAAAAALAADRALLLGRGSVRASPAASGRGSPAQSPRSGSNSHAARAAAEAAASRAELLSPARSATGSSGVADAGGMGKLGSNDALKADFKE